VEQGLGRPSRRVDVANDTSRMVPSNLRHCPDQRKIGCDPSPWHHTMPSVWQNRYHFTSNDWMHWHGWYMALDAGTYSNDAPYWPRHVPPEWTIRPDFHIWPPRRWGAILWLLAHMVYYCIQQRKRLIDTGYTDILRRARWKNYQNARRLQRVGNYLELLSQWAAWHRNETTV
jgi:hypothetical protein